MLIDEQRDEIEYQLQIDSFRIQCLTARQSNKTICEQYKLTYLEGIRLFTMTPQEELFSKLFNHEKSLVKDMDDVTLRSHREELSRIAFEARARLSAADDEEKTRKPKAIKGFSRSVKTDDVTSDAINHIVERTKEQKKADKFLEGMAKLGISNDVAMSMLSAGTIKAHLEKKNGAGETVQPTLPIGSTNPERQAAIDKAVEEINTPKSITPFVNPFSE